MKRRLITLLIIVASLTLTAGIAKAASGVFDSLTVGKQGTGGVTYFNGTIVNNTTSGGVDSPVTFGDNVRIDGRVYRGATAGTIDTLPFIINDNMELAGTLLASGTITSADIQPATDNTYSIGTATAGFKNAYIDGTLTLGSLAGTGNVSSTNITDSTIATADLANDAVTPAKINGTGGANLPIAYGYCNSAGTTQGGTTNVSCAWDADNSRYLITISNEDYYYNDYIATVTPVGNTAYIARTSSVSNKLIVDFTTHAGVAGQQTDFAFVVYKIE